MVIINTKSSSKKKARASYGTGSLFYSESKKKWVGEVTLMINGEPKRKRVYGKSKTEVRHKLDELKMQESAGEFLEKNITTLTELAKAFIDNQLAHNEIIESTYSRKVETLKKIEPIGCMKIQEITEDIVDKFLVDQLDYSQSIINKIYQMLKATFREAMRKKIIVDNPMEYIKRPKSRQPKEEVRALSLEEERKLIAALNEKPTLYREQLLLSLFTGMRMGEINALEVSDINVKKRLIFVNRTITKDKNDNPIIGKTTKTYAGKRTIPVSQDVINLLVECIGDKKSGLIFLRKGELITTTKVNNKFSRFVKAHGIIDPTILGKVDTHSLRHTHASRAIEGGQDAFSLMKDLGHKDIKVTLNTYCSAFDEYRRKNTDLVEEYLKKQNLRIA